jgi:hypothetical protein
MRERLKLPVRLCVMPLLLILTACAGLPATSGIVRDAGERPEACEQFSIIRVWLGAANITSQEVQAALSSNIAEKDKIERVRALVGDTTRTILEAKQNNAAWHALCDQPGVIP